MLDQAPTQQIEGALAGLVVMADDVKLLTRRDVVRRRLCPAVGQRQAINKGVAQGLRSLNNTAAHGSDIWSDMQWTKVLVRAKSRHCSSARIALVQLTAHADWPASCQVQLTAHHVEAGHNAETYDNGGPIWAHCAWMLF